VAFFGLKVDSVDGVNILDDLLTAGESLRVRGELVGSIDACILRFAAKKIKTFQPLKKILT
jgi:hypothetical protein